MVNGRNRPRRFRDLLSIDKMLARDRPIGLAPAGEAKKQEEMNKDAEKN